MIPLKLQAIQTALKGDWITAITLNRELLKENPNDIETLNRLALAFTVVGRIKDAKSTYQKVLLLDNQNPIALKNTKRLINLHKSKDDKGGENHFMVGNIASMFLEENGKTKVIELINIADPKIISYLMTGEVVSLQIKRLKIFVLDGKKQYVGMLPDDIGKRLIKFIKGGNCYDACIKSVGNHKVIVFIKEIKRITRFKNQPSFLSSEKTKMVLPNKNHQSDKEDDESADTDESL